MAGQEEGTSPRLPSTPKAIGSMARKQGDVTRQGTQKMKFVPTLPVRRKKTDEEIKKEEGSAVIPPTPGRDRGLGRGRGRGRGGDGRGAAPGPSTEMTASGPFALGPSMGGTSSRRVPRSNFVPIIPLGSSSSSLDAGLTNSAPPALKDIVKTSLRDDEEAEVYSDPEDGVEIVDIQEIKRMDWMAPETLNKESIRKGKRVKQERTLGTRMKGSSPMKIDREDPPDSDAVNLANALDLSESEDEDDIEDLFDDFSLQERPTEEESEAPAEKLYFFQFPSNFPRFVSSSTLSADSEPTDSSSKGKDADSPVKKKVSFAEEAIPSDTPVAAPEGEKITEEDRTDGIIGQLEIYQSGVVKMRLNNGLVLDVAAATQPSFLQHAVHLDSKTKKLSVLGEVNRRFIAFPEMDTLLREWDSIGQITNEEQNKSNGDSRSKINID